jgi:hypothetical protein
MDPACLGAGTKPVTMFIVLVMSCSRFSENIVIADFLYRSYFKYILTKMVHGKVSSRQGIKRQQICRLQILKELPIKIVGRV